LIAQRLQLAVPEQVLITAMGLDMIRNRGCRDPAFSQAVGAQGFVE
jgi:energy-converting hydrogenase Eha subunit B